MKFPFIDIQAQRAVIADEVETALKRVLEHGQYILGPEVTAFETQLAEFEGGGHAVSCANGTDALSAQGMGCRLDGKAPVEWADVVTTSFFPAKPLGCYGDGGAILTKDEALKEQLLSLRFHGRGTLPGDHAQIGLNSRLDTMQAAILIEKLNIFSAEIKARNIIADRYTDALKSNILRTPKVIEGGLSTWAQYAVEVANRLSTWAQYAVEVANRDEVMAGMRAAEIPVAAYYPLPTHMQMAYKNFPTSPDGLPNTMAAKDVIMALPNTMAAKDVIMALPMHAYLKPEDQDMVIETLLGLV